MQLKMAACAQKNDIERVHIQYMCKLMVLTFLLRIEMMSILQ